MGALCVYSFPRIEQVHLHLTASQVLELVQREEEANYVDYDPRPREAIHNAYFAGEYPWYPSGSFRALKHRMSNQIIRAKLHHVREWTAETQTSRSSRFKARWSQPTY